METGIIILLCVILVAFFAIGLLLLLALNDIKGYLNVLELELRQTKQELKLFHERFENFRKFSYDK